MTNSKTSSVVMVDRRVTLKWLAGAMAAGQLAACGDGAKGISWAEVEAIKAKGLGKDIDFANISVPWPLTMTAAELATTAELVDLILPAEGGSPAPSKLGVPAFINEWVSAPYPQQQHDRGVVLPGLLWLEAEAQKRFSTPFARLSASQAEAILDAVCSLPDALPEHKQGAVFFACFRNIAAGAYYRTPEGWKALGYVGNTPSATFEGAPRELLEQLGLS